MRLKEKEMGREGRREAENRMLDEGTQQKRTQKRGKEEEEKDKDTEKQAG